MSGILFGPVLESGAEVPNPVESASVSSYKSDEGLLTGAGLPAIPGVLVTRIKRGEFIDLGELLPECIGELFMSLQKGKSMKCLPVVDNPVD